MEEKEALLRGEQNFQGNVQRNKSGKINGNENNDSSSDGSSDEWSEESHSECSSCCDFHSSSSYEWEKEIDENGELFYVESIASEANESFKEEELQIQGKPKSGGKTEKTENLKKGRLLNWVRRKESKKLHHGKLIQSVLSHSPLVKEERAGVGEEGKEFKHIVMKVDALGYGDTLSQKLLGLSLGFTEKNKIVVTSVIPNSLAAFSNEFSSGDIIHNINNYSVTSQNIENILQSFSFPCEIALKIEKTKESLVLKNEKYQSLLVQGLLKRNKELDGILLNQPVGIVVVDVEGQNLNKDDVIYCYPENCTLCSCRGAFVTLYHLLAEIRPNDVCQSSGIIMKNQPTHVLYSSDKNYLLLAAFPQSKCTLKEAHFIMNDLIRYLSFAHRSIKRCFECINKSVLDHFFSLFFCRVLMNGFSADSTGFPFLNEVSIKQEDYGSFQFEDIMPYANWVPLPKEAQVQIDEALNELEANDFEEEGEDNIENQRIFNILGSAFFHKGYLLASHLSKEDLLDVYAFHRQTCLIQLVHNEPVKSLIVWREVFPLSVNRGLPSRKPTSYIIPTGRWFMLTLGQGHDMLTVILESGECCSKIDGNPGPSVPYVEEIEDTLRHMQKLGLSALASQWIENNSRFRTVTPEDIFAKLANRKRDNLLGFVKALDGNAKVAASAKVSPPSSKYGDQGKRTRNFPTEISEDSASQTASNLSEISDENVPILGRRAERVKNSTENLSADSDSSDSDWDSTRDSNARESICSSAIDNFYLGDIGEILSSRLTTGPDDILFYYVHIDGNEGVLLNPPLNFKRRSVKMSEIMNNFRRCSQIIHSILQNSVRFKVHSYQDNSKCTVNKSLVAVKEHGVLFECFSSDSDSGKKPTSFAYWIVGRLFFAPQPREVYVCYHDEAPQNLVELAFRLGLNLAG